MNSIVSPYEVSLPDGTIVRVIEGNGRQFLVELDGEQRSVVLLPGRPPWAGWRGNALPLGRVPRIESTARQQAQGGLITAPMPGKVLEVLVKLGETVSSGDPLLLLEAMKMEMPLLAPVDGLISSISVCEGDGVSPGQTLIEIGVQCDG